MKYFVKVVEVGDKVEELLSEKMLIIFNENIPKELAEISVLHNIYELKQDIVTGDTVKIRNLKYEIVAVGKEANKTIKELGHCTFKFNDSEVPDLPGVINLKGKELKTIEIGDFISIY